MWLPDWLYERLPLMYFIAGGACLWLLGTSFAAALSGALLIAAAAITHMLRRSARKAPPVRVRGRARNRRLR